MTGYAVEVFKNKKTWGYNLYFCDLFIDGQSGFKTRLLAYEAVDNLIKKCREANKK
jgi:hypothetical protein